MMQGKVQRTRRFGESTTTGLLTAIALVVNLGAFGCGGDDEVAHGIPGPVGARKRP